MRLTLRTLLAWLDDTLSPAEVREIGRQVNESDFAKELVERIHRVTRQRRLTVPPADGPEAVDPNIVASYLDNELAPEQVGELEKVCLTSDVHLAEVASVHQVLSLIGQKAKVPVEARRRMYQLIRGPEAVRPRAARASRQTEPTPVSEPVQPWVSARPPARPLIERFGPAAGVLALMVVLCWSAWRTLTPADLPSRASPPLTPPAQVAVNAEPGKAEPKAKAGGVAAPAPSAETLEKGKAEAEPGKNATAAEGAPAAATAGPDPGPAKAKSKDAGAGPEKTKAATVVKAGSAGLARKPNGVLLRFSPDRRDWERLTDATPLREQDRLLSLAPFRATVEIGTAEVDLVEETEVWVRATPPSQAARLSLAQGRVVLHGTAPGLPFEVQFGGKTVVLTPAPGVAVGVERLNRRAPGAPTASASLLRVHANENSVRIRAGAKEETLEGPGAITVDPAGNFSDKASKAAPSWLTETEPTPFDQKVGEQFLKFFRDDRPIVSSLVEATEDDQKDVCRRAISALRAVGDVSYIVPLLNKKGDTTAPTARRAAVAVLRSYLAEGPEAAKTLRGQLQRDLGEGLATTAEKLLIGYTPKEAKEPATFTKLVQLLGSTGDGEIGLRELALDNLMQITGRDDLDYDPEKPEGKGLKAWRDLLREGELRPAASPNGAN